MFIPTTTLSQNVRTGARVYRSTLQTITNNTFTPLSFDTEVFDSSGYFDGGAPTRLTVLSSGVHRIIGDAQWVASASGAARIISLRKNGNSYFAYCVLPPHATCPVAGVVAAEENLSAGEYVELVVHQDSGGDLAVQVGSMGFPTFSISNL